jgi:short-subunit dehydrogenase
MSSLSALQGSALISNYAATKAYNILIGEGLWEEWREKGVDVLVCMASAIRTPNYVSSAPKSNGKFFDPSSEPRDVAASALSALGRQPEVIPGATNRLAGFFFQRLLPRQVAIRMMGRIMRGMYGR